MVAITTQETPNLRMILCTRSSKLYCGAESAGCLCFVFHGFLSNLTTMTFISVCLPFSYSLSSFRMLNVGLPVGAVKNALQRDGQDPSVMDLDQNRYVTLSTFIYL